MPINYDMHLCFQMYHSFTGKGLSAAHLGPKQLRQKEISFCRALTNTHAERAGLTYSISNCLQGGRQLPWARFRGASILVSFHPPSDAHHHPTTPPPTPLPGGTKTRVHNHVYARPVAAANGLLAWSSPPCVHSHQNEQSGTTCTHTCTRMDLNPTRQVQPHAACYCSTACHAPDKIRT